jgi:hypothetical protein
MRREHQESEAEVAAVVAITAESDGKLRFSSKKGVILTPFLLFIIF